MNRVNQLLNCWHRASDMLGATTKSSSLRLFLRSELRSTGAGFRDYTEYRCTKMYSNTS